jgi:hypothetical protein
MSELIDINATFGQFVRECIKPELKSKGWTGSCPTFYPAQGGNWGKINFQKSTSNTREDFKFTVNLGVVSGRIRRFQDPCRADKRPTVWDSHWQRRLGEFLPEANDKWWPITAKTTIEGLCSELTPLIIQIAVPQVESLVADVALRDLWLKGNWGRTEYQRLERLSILLKTIGPQELLQVTLDELVEGARRFGSGGMAMHHVKMLDQYSE